MARPVMHQYNPYEGNGQSHTYCGAHMEPAEYARMLDMEPGKYRECRVCSHAADEHDAFERAFDL